MATEVHGRKGGGKKESVLNLEKFMDKAIHVKFYGGREVTGILKGCDTLMNLVLDQTTEFKNELDDPYKKSGDERNLGLVVCRGTSINMVSPKDGMEQISNPFIQQ
jgi:U6 snRNA-associated Sm-like protein LSm7